MLGRFVRNAVAFLEEGGRPDRRRVRRDVGPDLIAIFAAVAATSGLTTSDMYNDIALQGVKVPP